MSYELVCGDCLTILPTLEVDSFDLVFFSPPYEDCRTYGISFDLEGQAYVDWMVRLFTECRRVCKGLVACVIEGKTRDFRYSATPLLLAADLHRAGFHLRKPPIFHRVGIPGSGGPDWLRNDYEFIICTTKGGKLPWSDNTSCGEPPKWAPGGNMSYRSADGKRKNAVPRIEAKDGDLKPRRKGPSQQERNDRGSWRPRREMQLNGELPDYKPPEIANPGNIISCIAGGGNMGSALAHQNEAPFPEKLCEFFIRSFCPPGGRVLDPTCGSGTTLAVAHRWGRDAYGIDLRESQVQLSRKRLEAETPMMPGMV